MRRVDRRSFVKAGLSAAGGMALAPLAGCGRSPVARAVPGKLVVVELAGGNDALSALVRFRDDAYYSARPRTAIRKDAALRIADDVGLHPSLSGFARRWDAGGLAIVEGCGYPDPVYSHFKAFEIWHAANESGRSAGDGWLGRLRTTAWGADPANELLVHIGAEMPYSLACAAHPAVAFQDPASLEWLGGERARGALTRMGGMTQESAGADPSATALARLRQTLDISNATSERVLETTAAYRTTTEYPDDAFAQSLKVVAALLQSDFRTRVYSVRLDGFDTHGGAQHWMYESLYTSLANGLDAFLRDIEDTSAEQEVAVLVFSEFSRRVRENHSGGTDHGGAGPMFLLGAPIAGGRYGRAPSLDELDEDGNLVFNTDFRSVYATVLADWMGVPPASVLGGDWSTLPLFRA